MSIQSTDKKFHVIIAGGGPVGLTAAHALYRAKISFTMLEMRHHPVVDAGSNLVINSVGLRALGQLGLLDELYNVSSELRSVHRMNHKGKDLGSIDWFRMEMENFGTWPRVLSRHDLSKTLYDALPESLKANVICNKKVSNVESTKSGVLVHCSDGSIYDGDIVIGADGAHSATRRSMRNLALEHEPSAVNDDQPFDVKFRCLWLRFPSTATSLVSTGTSVECHGVGAATQLFAGEESAVVGIYERLSSPTKQRMHYTREDEEAFVTQWGHLPAGLISLEEGVLKHWYWNSRIVLVGDAAHKFTPSTGSGCNFGIVDVVTLANELNSLPVFSSEFDINTAFQRYQEARQEMTAQQCNESGSMTDMATWGSWFAKFMDIWVLYYGFAQSWLEGQDAQKTATTPVFDYIYDKERLVGRQPWANAVPTKL
ncbi:FAD binding domain-containing protein [Colletotrichum truncatum]|uniref:FAD binding domain-containing protein n=1 Tax=Colletotrichum truncatum TaxID=5467 RepID=A0ACC3YQ84_COLTU|nr:FAD binding domain-containing protein [Colletotrichum truncatum]KAF6796641.1 FAD binding domain-containing protein [Colletotrichum truncatum]